MGLKDEMAEFFGDKKKQKPKKHPIDDMMEPMEDQEEIIREHPISMLRSIHFQLFGIDPGHDSYWTKKRIADKIIKELKK